MALTMTSWPLKASARSFWEVRSTLRDLVDEGTLLVEFARWMAVTLKPAPVRAARTLEPRFPVACAEMLVMCFREKRGYIHRGGQCCEMVSMTY